MGTAPNRGLRISDEIYRRLRIRAAETCEPMRAIAERALRRELGMESFRAAIYRAADGTEQCMTAPEDAHLSDEELIGKAMAEEQSAGLIGPEGPQVPEDEYRARLYVGEWVER